MNKYKIVAIIDLLVGIFASIVPLAQIFLVLPKVLEVYKDFGANYSLTSSYIAIAFGLLIGVANLFFSYKLFSSKTTNKDKYFTIGIISAIATFLISGLVSALISMSTLLPMFNLVNVTK